MLCGPRFSPTSTIIPATLRTDGRENRADLIARPTDCLLRTKSNVTLFQNMRGIENVFAAAFHFELFQDHEVLADSFISGCSQKNEPPK